MPTTLLVQLSDLHIREPGSLAFGRVDTAPGLRAAVDAVLALRQKPDAVVITGDLCDVGGSAEYRHLAQLLAPLPMPVYLLPGNHDDREQLRHAFPGHAYLGAEGYIQYALDVGGLRLIALDTVVAGQTHGGLCGERLAWLARELAQAQGRPVVVAMHHPPFETLIGPMDCYGLLEGGPELEALVARHANVERVICGHLHRAIDVRFGGSLASTCPSPAHQLALDLGPQARLAWTLEPPALRVHALEAGGRMVTHLAPVGRFEGPHPFHDGGALID